MKTLNHLLLVATVLLFSLVSKVHAEDAKVLNFGVISTESSQNLKSIWQPFLDDMEKQTGYEVKAFFAPDYAGIIQGMRFGKVDLAWYGNKSAMEAVDRANGEIFAQTVDVSGNPGYWSLLVTNKDSELNTLDDIFKNPGELVFGNGDPNSTSGFLVPSYYVFAKRGVDPKTTFKRVVNSNHETNLLAAASGQVDFATNNTESLDRLQTTRPEMAEKIKILWKSPLIPSDPIVWRADLDEATKEKIWNFFMNYGTGDNAAEEKKVLADLQWAPFKASSNDQLIPIRQLALFKQRAEVQNSDMSDKEKAEKVAEIQTQLNALERRLAALDARANNETN